MPKTKKYSKIYNLTDEAYLERVKSEEAAFARWARTICPANGKPYSECSDIEYEAPPLRKANSRKRLVFVTMNFDEKKIKPSGTIDFVKKILYHKDVVKGFAYWEWRDPLAETGLHCHIVLMGNTKRIIERCGRSNGPYIKLCSAYGTLRKYPAKYYNDKVAYSFETNDVVKTEKKVHNVDLRIKYELPNLTK